MSEQKYLSSTRITVSEDKVEELGKALMGAFEDYYSEDMLEPDGQDDGGNKCFTLYFNGNVGDSFDDRVQTFAKALSGIALTPVELQVRSDTMSDERDSHFYGGPEDEILAFRNACLAERVKALFYGGDYAAFLVRELGNEIEAGELSAAVRDGLHQAIRKLPVHLGRGRDDSPSP